MKIGVIGSGNIGGSLGRLWAAAGHQVCCCSSRGNKPLLSAANYYPRRDGEIDLGGLSHSKWAAGQLPIFSSPLS
ncbi:MAG: NAD(P)-binding domain-containing protein [Elainellaceae cyanobacterium]